MGWFQPCPDLSPLKYMAATYGKYSQASMKTLESDFVLETLLFRGKRCHSALRSATSLPECSLQAQRYCLGIFHTITVLCFLVVVLELNTPTKHSISRSIYGVAIANCWLVVLKKDNSWLSSFLKLHHSSFVGYMCLVALPVLCPIFPRECF